MTAWVIWSEEHRAWWGPNRCGYSQSLKRAGRYAEADAKSIQLHANNMDSGFNELALPLPDDFREVFKRKTGR